MRCIQSAQSHVRCLCVLRTDAIVWLDTRMLWYSASPFFGEVDRDHQAFALVVAAQLMDDRGLPAPARVSDGGVEHPHGQVEAVVR